MTEYRIRSESDLVQPYAKIREYSDAGKPFIVRVSNEPTRTEQMNKTVHKWFGEIAAQTGSSMAEVKAECNLTYGVPIKMRDDDEFRSAFGYFFEELDYQYKLKALRVFDIPITRNMKVKQLCEYMDQMQRDYLSQGFQLTIPEDARQSA